jgi:hypothetical protein
MLGVTVPSKYGGMDLDAKYAAVHWEEQMYVVNSNLASFDQLSQV